MSKQFWHHRVQVTEQRQTKHKTQHRILNR